jgi:hypothetical protein
MDGVFGFDQNCYVFCMPMYLWFSFVWMGWAGVSVGVYRNHGIIRACIIDEIKNSACAQLVNWPEYK